MIGNKYKSSWMISLLIALSLVSGCVQTDPATEVEQPIESEVEVASQETEVAADEQIDEEQEEEIVTFQYLDETKIDSERAMNVIRLLASEKYEGRKAGMETGKLAENCVVEMFEEIGLEAPESLNGFKQLYPQEVIYPVKASELSIVGSDEMFEYQTDFTERFLVGDTYFDADVTAEMVLVDKSLAYFKDASELDGKILLMSENAFYHPKNWKTIDAFQEDGVDIEGIIVPKTTYGPGGMIVSRGLRGDDGAVFNPEDPFYMNCSKETFDKLSVAIDEGKKIKVSSDFEIIDTEPANIVGVIPGKNEDGENETLIIGAHMDHVGNNMNGTYNPGALDNASGVAVLIELARIVSESEQPENTIVFVAFNGEEDGLLGSEYFVENPPVKYENDATKMINFDMVGSKNDVTLSIATAGESGYDMSDDIKDIADIMDINNKKENFGGSDHVNFAAHDIPAVMLIHYDDAYYHTHMDTPDNAISQERLEKVIRLGLALVDKEAYQDN